MSEKKLDYTQGIYNARELGAPRVLILGAQHMFAMFGATVLVPLLTLGLPTSATAAICCAPGWARCCSTFCARAGCRRFWAPALPTWAGSPS